MTTTPITRPRWVPRRLAAARGVAGAGRVIAVFQPHLYSRTQTFAAAFGAALGGADIVVVMDIYAAREDPVPGVTGALIAEAVPLPASVGALRAVLVRSARAGREPGPFWRRRAHDRCG